jgi:hypothetical protein
VGPTWNGVNKWGIMEMIGFYISILRVKKNLECKIGRSPGVQWISSSAWKSDVGM